VIHRHQIGRAGTGSKRRLSRASARNKSEDFAVLPIAACAGSTLEAEDRRLARIVRLGQLGTRRPLFASTIGVLAPLKVPSWLGESPIGAFTLGGRRHVAAAIEKRPLPRFMTRPGRRGWWSTKAAKPKQSGLSGRKGLRLRDGGACRRQRN
jgi:hypothetical protein